VEHLLRAERDYALWRMPEAHERMCILGRSEIARGLAHAASLRGFFALVAMNYRTRMAIEAPLTAGVRGRRSQVPSSIVTKASPSRIAVLIRPKVKLTLGDGGFQPGEHTDLLVCLVS
jgi:hypothetical protein